MNETAASKSSTRPGTPGRGAGGEGKYPGADPCDISLHRNACLPLFLTAAMLLLSVSPSFAQPPQSLSAQRDSQEVQQAIQGVMNDPEFRHLMREKEVREVSDAELPDWLKDFFKWWSERSKRDAKRDRDRDSVSPSSGSPLPIGQLLMYLALATVVSVIVYLIMSVLRRADLPLLKRPAELVTDEDAINPTLPPGEYAPEQYERRAVQFAESGDYRAAVRELVLGSMSWVERAGKIRHRRGLTNRDYVRALWRDTSRRDPMLIVVETFDLLYFGRRLASRTQYERCHEAFLSAFLARVDQ